MNVYSILAGEFMAQVLKEEIYDRIFRAGLDVFYEKDFRSAKMQDIAARAHIPVGLIYTYFKNKEALFDKIASSFRSTLSVSRGKKKRVAVFRPNDIKRSRKDICSICSKIIKPLSF